MRAAALLLCVAAAVPACARAAGHDYEITHVYSNVTFSIQKFFFTEEGGFSRYGGDVHLDYDHPEQSHVAMAIEAASIDTRNATRDKVLRSDDFFDVERYPSLTFVSRSVAPKSHDEFDVTGDLTIHGVTKRITIPVHYLGAKRIPGWGDFVGFESAFTIDRTEFGVDGLRWGGGTPVLGKEVKIRLSIGAMKK